MVHTWASQGLRAKCTFCWRAIKASIRESGAALCARRENSNEKNKVVPWRTFSEEKKMHHFFFIGFSILWLATKY